ncbi:MAG: DUF488 domain-containing protein [Phycisphaerae bacterium]|nr:DUF488 domain-containing protein [Phycisphaerae bacterium]
MPTVVHALGHSTGTIDDFIEVLEDHSISTLVDIRTIPKSRHNPQFNEDVFKRSLETRHIAYVHLKELGGLRKPRKDSLNPGWKNASFRGFADYMQTREFVSAIRKLMQLSRLGPVAIMCAEGNPFRCHRSLVADALTVRRGRVLHISGKTSTREHRMTPLARVNGTKITYP